jgi:SAM-dependent methyltransferase
MHRLNGIALIALSGPSGELPLDEVAVSLGTARRTGARIAVLAGQDPTRRRDLPRIFELIRRLGLEIGLVTDARSLGDPGTRELLREYGVSFVAALVAELDSHDLDGPRALHAMSWDGLRLDLAVVVTTLTAPRLVELFDEVESWTGRGTLCVRIVAPDLDLPADRWPAASLVTEHVDAALGRVGAGVVAAWEGFPPCLLEAHAHLCDESLRSVAPRIGPPEACWPLPLENTGDRAHAAPCLDCLHRSACPGVPRAFLERDGASALRPTRAVHANSFNFVVVDVVPGAIVIDRRACSARSLDVEEPPIRQVIVVTAEDRARICRTPTSDFTDAEIADVKDRLEQIYLDCSRAGAALDDFLESVRRLRLHPECRECPDRPGCPTVFVEDPDPPFRREERWLRKEVSRLRGRVLDVGCGEQLYRDVLDELIAKGEVEYHGLDPERAALERMRASGFRGALHEGVIETFDWQPGYFDYVLLLRSFNHLRDVDRAFDVVARVLRPRGQLVMCDSPPFALVRTADQVAHADEHAPKGHEHFRNSTSHEALEMLARHPFRVDVHRPVSAKTSAQWILKLMRTG